MRFKDKDIEAFWEGASLPRRVPPTCRKALFRKLQMLEAARDLADLRIPPSNLSLIHICLAGSFRAGGCMRAKASSCLGDMFEGVG